MKLDVPGKAKRLEVLIQWYEQSTLALTPSLGVFVCNNSQSSAKAKHTRLALIPALRILTTKQQQTIRKSSHSDIHSNLKGISHPHKDCDIGLIEKPLHSLKGFCTGDDSGGSSADSAGHGRLLVWVGGFSVAVLPAASSRGGVVCSLPLLPGHLAEQQRPQLGVLGQGAQRVAPARGRAHTVRGLRWRMDRGVQLRMCS